MPADVNIGYESISSVQIVWLHDGTDIVKTYCIHSKHRIHIYVLQIATC